MSEGMRQVNLILLILLCTEKANLEVRLNRVDEPSILPGFIIRILRNHFGAVRKMAVLFSEPLLDVTDIVRDVDVPVVVNANETPRLQGLDTREPCQVVLLAEPPDNVPARLKTTLWTSETLFLLAVARSDVTDGVLEAVFRTFWTENVVNVFAFVAASRDVSVYTYSPAAAGNCDGVEKLSLDAESEGFLLSNQVKDFRGCILNVTAVDLPPMTIFPTPQSRNGTFRLEGTEVNIIREVSDKLNFTPRFAVARDGEAWGWINPSPHGAVGEVYEKRSHFAVGLLASTLERYEFLDMTPPVCPVRECITWAVPVGAARSEATWVQLYVNEFTLGLWSCIGLLFLVASLVFWAMARAFHSPTYARVMLLMFSSLIYVPVRSPKPAALRIAFLSWVLYSFVLMISYQSLMGTKLTVPYRSRDIDTVRDLLESDLHFTGFNNTFRLIRYETNGDMKKLTDRLEPTTYGIKEAVRYIVDDRNVSYLRETTSFMYYIMSHPETKGKVHFMKECLYEYYPVMVLQKNSPLTRKTNQVISQLTESGILASWRRRYIYRLNPPPPSAIQLTLEHMLAAFAAWLLGIALSAVAFLGECSFHRSLLRVRARSSGSRRSERSNAESVTLARFNDGRFSESKEGFFEINI